MKSFLAIGWRLLLAFALVANPLAAALAAPCHDAMASAPASAGKMPPCHHAMAATKLEQARHAPAGNHGHDCAKAGCDFGACCVSCVLVTASSAPLLHPALHDIVQAEGARALAGPPLPPLIRPPIA